MCRATTHAAVQEGEFVESFRPAEGFLRYLKLHFWILLILIDVAILIGWIILTAAAPVAGILLAGPALFLAVVPDVIAYVAIHLRYDTTWYVVSDRSLRIRRGIWIIQETTITFENVQNVSVNRARCNVGSVSPICRSRRPAVADERSTRSKGARSWPRTRA